MRKIVFKSFSILICIVFLINLAGCKKDKLESSKTKYSIYCSLDNNVLNCSQNVEYVNTQVGAISSVVFILYPKAFSQDSKIKPVSNEDTLKAYYSGESYGDILIESVYQNGKKSNYKIENISLIVDLVEPLKKGDTASINLQYKVTIPKVNHRFGITENTINLGEFFPIIPCYENGFKSVEYYPVGDPFYLDNSNFHVELTLPSTYIVCSSMSPEKVEVMGGATTYVFNRENAKTITFVLSQKFSVVSKKINDVNVFYYYFKDEAPEKTLDVASSSLEYFSNIFYKYPYNEYVVCEADFLYGGMEYPAFSLISSTEDRIYTTVHETAHQWFYSILGVNQIEEGYLDEGLTEFATTLYFKNRLGEKEYERLINQTKVAYKNLRVELVGEGINSKPIMKKHLNDFLNDKEYVSIAYYRSLIMFDKISRNMGEEKFIKFLKEYIENHKYTNITGENFYGELNKKSKSSAQIYKNFVNGKELGF